MSAVVLGQYAVRTQKTCIGRNATEERPSQNGHVLHHPSWNQLQCVAHILSMCLTRFFKRFARPPAVSGAQAKHETNMETARPWQTAAKVLITGDNHHDKKFISCGRSMPRKQSSGSRRIAIHQQQQPITSGSIVMLPPKLMQATCGNLNRETQHAMRHQLTQQMFRYPQVSASQRRRLAKMGPCPKLER